MDSVFPKPYDDDILDVAEGIVIVIDGDTAPKAISAGQYLFIKNHSTLATGGYHATAAIASGASITSSNVAVDANGIANALNEKVSALNSNLGNFKQYINDYIGNNQTRTYTLENRKIHLMSIATLGNGSVDDIYLAVVATPDNTSASGKIYWITDAPNSAISCTLSGFTLTVTTNGAWPILAIMRM